MIKSLVFFIIDDDVDDRELFCEVIAELCDTHRCVTASNGQEALQLLQKEELLPDFIFLDLNMPRMNGKQCLVQLKANERLSKIPVVIYSTSKAVSDKEETRRLGAQAFITKPTCMHQLKRELELVFDKHYKNISN